MTNAFLRLPQVKARTGLSRSSIYQRAAEGTFPRPVHLGARAVGWVEADIEEWISQKIKETRDGILPNANCDAHFMRRGRVRQALQRGTSV
jgi:prophage regulatory protein